MNRRGPTNEVSEIVERMDGMKLCEIKEFFSNNDVNDQSIQESATTALAINVAATIAIAAKACTPDRHAAALSMLATISASVTTVLLNETEDAGLDEKDEAQRLRSFA
jgi:hypothetical protein